MDQADKLKKLLDDLQDIGQAQQQHIENLEGVVSDLRSEMLKMTHESNKLIQVIDKAECMVSDEFRITDAAVKKAKTLRVPGPPSKVVPPRRRPRNITVTTKAKAKA